MDSPRSALLDEVDLKAPWELVEAFSRQPRWRPEDVNRGADMIVARLTALGVPVTVHEPEIYLSIPFEAEVRAAGRVIRAKPPAYSASAPEGVTGEIAYAPAAYSKSIGTLFDKNAKAVAPEQLRGKIVVSEGFAFPHKVRELEALGDRGHRRQSRRRHPLGHLHLDLGHARPRRPAAKAHHPGRGREQPGWARADRSCRQRRASHVGNASRRGLVSPEAPGRRDRRRRRGGEVRPPARPLRFVGRRRRGQRDRKRDAPRDRARARASPQAAAAFGADRLV